MTKMLNFQIQNRGSVKCRYCWISSKFREISYPRYSRGTELNCETKNVEIKNPIWLQDEISELLIIVRVFWNSYIWIFTTFCWFSTIATSWIENFNIFGLEIELSVPWNHHMKFNEKLMFFNNYDISCCRHLGFQIQN